jgi:four helix bundle protein
MNQRDGDNLPEKSATSPPREYNLERRTAQFAKDSINFAKGIRRNVVVTPLIRQFVRSSTSIGANYCEADDAVSRKEFHCKIAICKKEARETKYWIQLLVTADPTLRDPAKPLWREAKELHLIFTTIARRTKT